MTWSVQDPSLSHATSGAIRNLMGRPGAIGADMLMQILGLGSIMLILPVAVWGWRLVTHRLFDREALRVACWILCAVIAAGFASCRRAAAHGRCRPDLAALSAMRWCAFPPSCLAPRHDLSHRPRHHPVRSHDRKFLLSHAARAPRRRLSSSHVHR
jgi:hypothetical protein